ncbi:hypothetical protein CSB93_3464 [Pseudomonas paraeruginosa]|uniref:Uncharacterized protein n=1 Tax=Pseudomonas paraeruginosa TaxID=2994495 RepID=A0A2R3IN57_9PSED|nr:hypothetical protein CSB93_3464 [Pseudomonas paraeruginosa]AWE93831.1 hypothetical protein CSC28_2245 [Pseudomonas paraeruginosa]
MRTSGADAGRATDSPPDHPARLYGSLVPRASHLGIDEAGLLAHGLASPPVPRLPASRSGIGERSPFTVAGAAAASTAFPLSPAVAGEEPRTGKATQCAGQGQSGRLTPGLPSCCPRRVVPGVSCRRARGETGSR